MPSHKGIYDTSQALAFVRASVILILAQSGVASHDWKEETSRSQYSGLVPASLIFVKEAKSSP